MPAIENVTRRGAVYWWRRRVRFAASNFEPITIATTVSLLTKEQGVARWRGAALTQRSESLRMSLYDKIEREGLTAEQVTSLFQEEIVRYRNMLAHQYGLIQSDGEGDVQTRMAEMLGIYAALNADFAVNGFGDYMSIGYVGAFDERFANLDDEARGHLNAMLSRAGDLPAKLLTEARDLLGRVGIAADGDRIENARRIMCEARATAAATYNDPAIRGAADVMALFTTLAKGIAPISATRPISPLAVDAHDPPTAVRVAAPNSAVALLTEEQQKFAVMTAVQAVDEFFRVKPKAGGKVGSDASVGAAEKTRAKKSRAKVWGDSQRRQFRAAPFLFGKSNGGKPLAATTQDDLNTFYDHLNRLPATHHKSSRHEPMSLEDICEEAAARAEKAALAATAGRAEATAGADECDTGPAIGLDVGTINRHFANLKKLCIWVAAKTPMMALDFSDFILEEDDRDERDERDPYTVEQA